MTGHGLLEPEDLKVVSFLLGTSNRPTAVLENSDLPAPKQAFELASPVLQIELRAYCLWAALIARI
jgi:hypothetical protein